ncbi:RNA polymerase sigma factor [Cytobacillus purgationiresistens]|uniref:RNA polymerase sigma-70 factor (ECF subfamily) n=1 Tax=Cytobacillus purgationiresistens TaxID=863449 RepID=A0ABU0AAP8_9BACI|nr:RNA polymerase sigma factor [Cytobacillus purgationiresistens]MDQ0268322.1 RNA polymerase sigma-70 factor (ECF subfamily) [Cytobacillus purgationiresistens]
MDANIEKHHKIMALYDLHSDSILKYVGMLIQDFHKAEDITQDTFFKAYQSFDQFQGQASLKTWLFSIARNSSLDYLRKQQRSKLLFTILSHSYKERTRSTEQVVQINEDIEQLYSALDKLKFTYREVIILRKIKEFSTKETAEILGWSESKVKSTLSRGINHLEKLLLKEEHYEELS